MLWRGNNGSLRNQLDANDWGCIAKKFPPHFGHIF